MDVVAGAHAGGPDIRVALRKAAAADLLEYDRSCVDRFFFAQPKRDGKDASSPSLPSAKPQLRLLDED